MRTEQFTKRLECALLTFSTIAALLLAPLALAQDRTQANPTARNTFIGGSDGPTEQKKEEAIIRRSFRENADLKKATKLEAGSTLPIDPNDVSAYAEARDRDASIQEPGKNADDPTVERTLSDVPEGAGVITKGGKVIAQTREQPASVENQTDPEPTAQASKPNIRYRSIKGMQVVNAEGQEIGTVTDVVINTMSGDTSLLIAKENMAGTGTVKVLAPIREVAIVGNTAVWNTLKTQGGPEQTDRHRSNPNDAKSDATTNENLSQR